MTEPVYPLHSMDGDHARIIQAVQDWTRNVYPGAVMLQTDRTKLWWMLSGSLLAAAEKSYPDNPPEALASLAALCAEAMLAYSECATGKVPP